MKTKPTQKKVKISEIIQWIFANNDTYPVDDDFLVTCPFENDHPENANVGIWIENLVNLTKSGFGKYTGKDLSQVSRWLRSGMPVREDGRLNLYDCEQWLTRYQAENKKRQGEGWK